ncbi:hypothetical protein [Alkalihalobacterium bogoriense]|uniref:hypothetical protein n=1 Tax=Alkalihalobacterium bogoriense TaxID=246272 RepID=UPI00047C3C09|nr:hypothetical protein [Alkalihalobacterium bogoriense]
MTVIKQFSDYTFTRREELQEIIEVNYLKVPINDIVSKVVEGLYKLKNAEIDEYDYNLSHSISTSEKISIELNEEHFKSISQVKQAVSLSQVQLLIYLLHLFHQGNAQTDLLLEAKDYFKHRAIKLTKASKDRLERDLLLLSSITIEVEVKKGKRKDFCYSRLLDFKKVKRGYYEVSFGTWISHLSNKSYTLVHKKLLQYHPSRDWISILLSLKLAQLAKLQFPKNYSTSALKFSTIFNLLDIDHRKISKQGIQYYSKILSEAFNQLQQDEQYRLHFNLTNVTYTELMNAKLEYTQPLLIENYRKKPKGKAM